MSCFDTAPEFIDEDNRKFRTHNPVSKSQMEAKHEALFPPELLHGKTVLDLGSCLGATGHWCLSNGASYYVGVEVQNTYAELSKKLLGKYHPGKFSIECEPLESWLAKPHTEQFDFVCILGVLYCFADFFSILKHAAALSREYIAVEGIYPRIEHPEVFCGVTFIKTQPINLADQNASVVGRGALISPKGMEWLMEEFGFSAPESIIRPRAVTDIPDIYNRDLSHLVYRRYLMRFKKGIAPARTMTDLLQQGGGRIELWDRPPVT